MTWSLYPARHRFGDFAQTWDSLNHRFFDAHPFFDSRFVGPLIHYFATDGDILALHEGSEGVDSMLLLTRRRAGIWATFLPGQTQVAPILPHTHVDLGSLLRHLPGPAIVLELLCQDPLYSVFSLESSRLPQTSSPHTVTMNITLSGDFEQYWQARHRKIRENFRRYFRRLSQASLEPRLEVLTQPTELSAALERYGDIENQSWKGKAGTAIHRDNIQGQFYRDVLLGFARDKQAVMYELYLNDRLVSSQISIANASMLILLKTTYDEAFAANAPGRILDYLLLQKVFADKRFSVVEFYTNASSERQTWGTGIRTINHITVYRAGIFQQLAHTYRRLKSYLHR
jgi:hypothetical protein